MKRRHRRVTAYFDTCTIGPGYDITIMPLGATMKGKYICQGSLWWYRKYHEND